MVRLMKIFYEACKELIKKKEMLKFKKDKGIGLKNKKAEKESNLPELNQGGAKSKGKCC
jgi:hypothetical protein